MSSGADGSPPDPADEADGEAARRASRKESDDAWAATSMLISGVGIWGGAGYVAAQWWDAPLLTMVGLLVGTATALYGIWFRYGRS
jgi:ATP synthase protein I